MGYILGDAKKHTFKALFIAIESSFKESKKLDALNI